LNVHYLLERTPFKRKASHQYRAYVPNEQFSNLDSSITPARLNVRSYNTPERIEHADGLVLTAAKRLAQEDYEAPGPRTGPPLIANALTRK
jgi:hypothetical protein